MTRPFDLDAWIDASVWLLGCPKKLIEIAGKRMVDIPLGIAERKYLWKWRKREQLSLTRGNKTPSPMPCI